MRAVTSKTILLALFFQSEMGPELTITTRWALFVIRLKRPATIPDRAYRIEWVKWGMSFLKLLFLKSGRKGFGYGCLFTRGKKRAGRGFGLFW